MMQIMKWDDNIAAMEAEKAPGIHVYIKLYLAKLESV